jgi:hypothetical protein
VPEVRLPAFHLGKPQPAIDGISQNTETKNPKPFELGVIHNMAEEQRFELWNGFPSTVFKTVAFSHSATPP